jgi:phosphoenolpyruvate carboxykinase (GTP)
LDVTGLNVPAADMQLLTAVDAEGWKKEAADIAGYYAKFESRLPEALKKQVEALKQRLG